MSHARVGPPKMYRSWWRVLTKRGPQEKGMANHFSILAWRIHKQRNLVGYSPKGHKELDTTKAT